MDQRERYLDDAETMRLALEALQSRLWTSLPCVVQAFPAASGLGPRLLDAQPTIAGSYVNSKGQTIVLQMPLLVDVPVWFPGGGGVTIPYPIAQGDECLVIFSARCIDAWWQLGAGQAPNPGYVPPDARLHNLSDGIAFVGLQSLPQSLATYATLRISAGGSLSTPANVAVGNGATGSFSTPTGQTVDVQDGIITNIY